MFTKGRHTGLPLQISIITLLVAGIVSVCVAPNHLGALGLFRAYLLEPILLFFMAQEIISSSPENIKQKLFAALVLSATVSALVAIFQSATGLALPAPWDFERRATGLFAFPNAHGLFAGPIFFLTIPLIANAWKQKQRARWLGWSAAAVTIFISIVLSQTEAAALAAIAVGGFWLLWNRSTRHYAITGILVLGILTLSVPAIRVPLTQKLLLHDASGEVRRVLWSESSQMLKDRPLFGAGLGQFPTALAPYHTRPEIELYQYPHQLFLNIWSELGVLGLIGFLFLALTIAWHAWHLHRERQLTIVHLAIFAALLHMTVHGLVDVAYFKNDLSVLTWLLLATTLRPS